jgi:hypothetical protein
MYHEMLFMGFGKEIDPQFASHVMGDLSEPVVRWRMKVSNWRHINIAIRNALCKGSLDASIEEDTLSSVHAYQAGHSVATEQRIYGLTHDMVQGVSTASLRLFLKASRDYQIAMLIPPGGLGLRMDNSTMSCFERLVAQGLVKVPPKRAAFNSVATEVLTALQQQTLLTNQLMDAMKQQAADHQRDMQCLMDKIDTLQDALQELAERPHKALEDHEDTWASGKEPVLGQVDEPVDSEEDGWHSPETHHPFSPPMSHLPSPPPTQAKLQHTAQSSPKRSRDYSGEPSFVVSVVGSRN